MGKVRARPSTCQMAQIPRAMSSSRFLSPARALITSLTSKEKLEAKSSPEEMEPLVSTGEQKTLNRPGRPPSAGSPEEMEPLVAPPPTKKRKLSKTENAKCNEKELKNSFCKNGDVQEKVREVAGGGSQDVTVAFYAACEVPLRDKKDGEILKVCGDLKQGARGMLQIYQSKIKKNKEEIAKAPQESHHDDFKERPKNCQRFSLFKMRNLKDLLPSSKFHSVRKRTPVSYRVEHKRTICSLYSPNELDSEPKVDAVANRRTYFPIPMPMEAAQNGTLPLVSEVLERRATKSDLFPVCPAERMLRNLIFMLCTSWRT